MSHEGHRNTNWHYIVIALLIGFGSGILFDQSGHFFGPRGKRWDKEHMMKKFNSRLHLNPEQQQKVSAIFEAQHPKMMALHEETRPKFEVLRNEVDAEIRKLLTPEQAEELTKMSMEMESRRKNREKFFHF